MVLSAESPLNPKDQMKVGVILEVTPETWVQLEAYFKEIGAKVIFVRKCQNRFRLWISKPKEVFDVEDWKFPRGLE